jgi:hypothetical protein
LGATYRTFSQPELSQDSYKEEPLNGGWILKPKKGFSKKPMISDNYSDLIGFFMLGKSLKVATYNPVCFFQVRDNKS